MTKLTHLVEEGTGSKGNDETTLQNGDALTEKISELPEKGWRF